MPQSSESAQKRVDVNAGAAPAIKPEDRISPPDISAKKRTILGGIGFLERVYNLMGSTASIVATAEGAQLRAAVTGAIEALSRLLH